MPSGEIHLRFNRRSSPVFVILGALMLVFGEPGILAFVGYLFGLLFVSRYIDPDADQLGLTQAEGRAMREWKITRVKPIQEIGGCLGFLLVWWMFPYAYIMKYFGGHRGLSHVPIIGTISRLIWLFSPLFFAWWWYYYPWQSYVVPFGIGLFCGLSVADVLHIFLDFRGSK